MSKTEELALNRIGASAVDPLEALARAQQLRRDDRVLADIVADNQRASQCAPGPTPTVRVDGAGVVVTGTDGHGWVTAPSIDKWRPPGIDIIDRMVDQQDAIDRAERERQFAQLKKGGAG